MRPRGAMLMSTMLGATMRERRRLRGAAAFMRVAMRV